MQRALLASALLIGLHAGALAQPASVQGLAWLQGCWEINSPERVVEEQWTAPRAHSMLGSSRTLRGDKLVAHEFVLLREQDRKSVV